MSTSDFHSYLIIRRLPENLQVKSHQVIVLIFIRSCRLFALLSTMPINWWMRFVLMPSRFITADSMRTGFFMRLPKQRVFTLNPWKCVGESTNPPTGWSLRAICRSISIS